MPLEVQDPADLDEDTDSSDEGSELGMMDEQRNLPKEFAGNPLAYVMAVIQQPRDEQAVLNLEQGLQAALRQTNTSKDENQEDTSPGESEPGKPTTSMSVRREKPEIDHKPDKDPHEEGGLQTRSVDKEEEEDPPFKGESPAELRDVVKNSNRIRSLEDCLDHLKKELADIKRKLDRALALAPCLEELAQGIATNQKEQTDTYSVLLSEVHNLKQNQGPVLESCLKQHEFEINTLASRLNHYYTYATKFLFPDAYTANNAQNTFAHNNSTITAPESRMITAY